MRRLPALAAAGLLASSWLAPSSAPAGAEDEPATDVDPSREGAISTWIQADAQMDTTARGDQAQSVTPPSTAAMLDAPASTLPIPAATGPVLLVGRVTTSPGSSAGGEVAVYLDDEANGPMGAIVAKAPIASTSVGTNGSFVASPSVEARIRAAMDEGGRVNLMVAGTLGGRGFLTHLIRQWDAEAARWTTTDGSTDVAADIVANMPLEAAPASSTRGVKQYISCTDTIARSYQVTSVVGEAQVSPRFAGGTFKFTGGQDTELGIAVQYGSGAWGGGGSTSISQRTSVANEFPINSDEHRVIYGNFQYRDIKTTCSTGYTVSTSVRAKPYAWNGGVWKGPTTSERFCGGEQTKWRQQVAPGATFTRDKVKAQTWSNALTVHGVGLTSRAGYSTAVTQTWKVGKQPTWVCGSDNFPSSSKRVFTSSSIR